MLKKVFVAALIVAFMLPVRCVLAENLLSSTALGLETGWEHYVQADSKKAGSYVKYEDGRVVIHVAAKPSFAPTFIQVKNKGLNLECGKRYRVSFKASIDQPDYLRCTYRRGKTFEREHSTRIVPGKQDYQFILTVQHASANPEDVGTLFFWQGAMTGKTLTLWELCIQDADVKATPKALPIIPEVRANRAKSSGKISI
jgi:hypothetical protein